MKSSSINVPLPAITVTQAGLVAALFCLFAFILTATQIGRRAAGLPPGPPTTPFFGNLHQIPETGAHLMLTEWGKKYGGLISFKRSYTTSIVVNDWFYVRNLLDKKSNIYSNRPMNHIIKFVTGNENIAILQYGDTWRTMRKLINQTFRESACDKQHYKIQEAEAVQMLYDFLTKPEENMLHPRRFSNSMTTSTVLGWRAKDTNDPHMRREYHILEKWSYVLDMSVNLPLDALPFLKYVPERLLGNWRSRSTECRDLMESLYYEVVDKVRKRREQGIHKDSLMDRALDQQDKNQFSDHQLAFLAGTLLEGGSDTSSALILAIIQAMMQYPEVQRKAQAEIDSVVGPERSPRWSDFSMLPYINMMIKEAHRWKPILPLGISHAVAQDDNINGMHIPKGSEVIINIWALHYDEKKWKSPEHFIPERYQDYPELAPFYAASSEKRDHIGYGASRRICPGIHLAERNLFIGAAKLLWAFNFSADPSAAKSPGKESAGFIQHIQDYKCNVELRDEAKRATILRELEEAQSIFSQYE